MHLMKCDLYDILCIVSEAARVGHVKTILGRVRHLPDLTSKDKSKRSQAERQAINSIIQGSASDIIKFAMLIVEKALSVPSGNVTTDEARKPQAVMQIHDELVYDVYDDTAGAGTMEGGRSVHAFVSLLNRCMEGEVVKKLQLCVPLVTNVRVGASWGHLEAYLDPSFRECLSAQAQYPLLVDVSAPDGPHGITASVTDTPPPCDALPSTSRRSID